MPTNDPVPPSGEASSSVSRKGGKPAKAVPRAARAAARPDLDAHDQRITLPRRAMGPPLGRPLAHAQHPRPDDPRPPRSRQPTLRRRSSAPPGSGLTWPRMT